MKKKIVMIILGIFLIILLYVVPSNYVEYNDYSTDQDFAYSPPVKLPKLPPKE